MKIINIVPGFGGTFYCGNCLRDSGYTKSLIALGHDAMMVPIYLPLTLEHGVEENEFPIFFGAVNVYLKQNFKIFRKMPAWMKRMFNSSSILRYAAKQAGSTRTDGLEEMTISMLRGKNGNQNAELQEMIDFLQKHIQPDIIHLSNALLLGLAEQIKEQLKIPVVCSLQDEDVWVDAMKDKYRDKVWNLMSEVGENVDAFISVSQYYANEMKRKMRIPDDKMYVVPIGLDYSLYKYSEPAENPQAIGFLSRMYEEHGFGLFIDSYIKLKQDPEFKDVLLKLSGGYTADDKKYVKKQIKKLKKAGVYNDVEFIEDFMPEDRYKFFEKVTFLTVPVLKGEAFGIYQLESMLCGVPVVQPALGAFPEIIEQARGGITYSPNNVETIVEIWKKFLPDKEKIQELSKKGRETVEQNFSNEVLSRQVLDVYEKLVKS